MKILVIIPVFNEERNITNVISRINSLDFDKEIIVVDDFSNDKSIRVINDINGIKKGLHSKN